MTSIVSRRSFLGIVATLVASVPLYSVIHAGNVHSREYLIIDEKGNELDIEDIPFRDTKLVPILEQKVDEMIEELTKVNTVTGLSQAFSDSTQYWDYIKMANVNTSSSYNFITALMTTESDAGLRKKSWAGARGPMQLMPATARYMELEVGDFIDDRMHPKSIMTASDFVDELRDKYGNNVLVLAAYNMGETKLNSKIRKHGRGITNLYHHLPSETQRYIVKVFARERILDNLDKYPNVQITQQPLFSRELDESSPYAVKPEDNITQIARAHGLKIEDIQRVNPEINDFGLIGIGQKLRIPKKT